MRPVSKKVLPKPIFTDYKEAAEPLIDKLGSYCCYCERHIETHLAVEHVRPKSINPALATDWDNFLLSCCNCNSSKGSTPVVVANYLWPDCDNTLRAFVYRRGLVSVDSGLVAHIKVKAEALLELVGLDKDPGNPIIKRKSKKKDLRWKFREDRWDAAQHALRRLVASDTVEMREQIVETAVGRGGFAIWFTIFSHDEDMRKRFIAAFLGTENDCFDVHGQPVARPGGVL